MKNKFYILAVSMFAFFGSINAQVAPLTGDAVALPTTPCPIGGTVFGPSGTYTGSPLVQLGVNNTGTDLCRDISTGRNLQVMVWDEVTSLTSQTNFTSKAYFSWVFNNGAVGSISFADGFDPDVAIWSDNVSGTFAEVAFENNLTGKIDGYTYQWNGSTFVLYNAFKCTLSHDANKKAKNPNLASTKDVGRYAIVWHEEGVANPAPSLTVSYSTVPPYSYTINANILESKVYIHCWDKPGYLGDLLGSPTSSIINIPGTQVIRNIPPGTNHLFDRDFNPDVSYGEMPIGGSGSYGAQTVISVAFLSSWFDPSTFSVQTGSLSVVQGNMDDFRWISPPSTTTQNFTTAYSGKPRIASRLTLAPTYTAKDFSVVMGNSALISPCGAPSYTVSQIHYWWYNTGTGSVVCPAGGVDILSGTPYASVTTVNPVISCVNAKGHYAVAFSSNNASAFDYNIVANTYKQGALIAAGAYSMVNYGTCAASSNGVQILPSIASYRRIGGALTDDAYSNYLFWDQSSKSLNYKKLTTNKIPGAGMQLRQMDDETSTKDDQTKFLAYPNPTDSEISFDFKLDANEIASEIEIFNMSGQSVDKFAVTETSNQKRTIDKMPSGTYIAILKTNLQNHKLQFIRK